MTTYDNGDPMPDWTVEPRCCPFEQCVTCGPTTPTIPPNIELGSE